MKLFRQIFGGLTAGLVVVTLTVAILACAFMLGFVSSAMHELTQVEERVSPGPPSDAQVALNVDH